MCLCFSVFGIIKIPRRATRGKTWENPFKNQNFPEPPLEDYFSDKLRLFFSVSSFNIVHIRGAVWVVRSYGGQGCGGRRRRKLETWDSLRVLPVLLPGLGDGVVGGKRPLPSANARHCCGWGSAAVPMQTSSVVEEMCMLEESAVF